MRVGLDIIPENQRLIARLRSAKLGLVAHAASVNRRMTHISDVLRELAVSPRRIFGPEHGYGSEAQDMDGVAHAADPQSGAEIVSLYGSSVQSLSPRPEHLVDLDTLLIDLCDVGTRYYTFVWTAVLAMRAACSAGLQCIVLDRPNPIGGLSSSAEGAMQDEGYLSFVGLERVPIRHGLSLGEMVGEMAARDGLSVGRDQQVEVVGVQGWQRGHTANAWDRPFVPPSPNMPTVDTALVYPGGCLLEGTNLSEGRGTTRPFEIFGAPWLDGRELAQRLRASNLPGFVARPLRFRPMFHKYAGQICGGLQIHVVAPQVFRPVATYLAVVCHARGLSHGAFRFRTEPYEFVDSILAFDLLTGSSRARLAIEADASERDVIANVCLVDDAYLEMHARAVERVAACG